MTKRIEDLTPEERIARREREHQRYLRRRDSYFHIKKAESEVKVRDLSASVEENRQGREEDREAERKAMEIKKQQRHIRSLQNIVAYRHSEHGRALNNKYQKKFLKKHPGYQKYYTDRKKALEDIGVTASNRSKNRK